MADFNPWELEQALIEGKQIASGKALSAGGRARGQAEQLLGKERQIEELWARAWKLSGKDRIKAEQLLKVLGTKQNIKDPKAELAAIKKQIEALETAGAYDRIGSGKLPPNLEQAARTFEPWMPSVDMRVDQAVRNNTISAQEREGYRSQIADEPIETKQRRARQEALLGAPIKTVGENNPLVTPLQFLMAPAQAVEGALVAEAQRTIKTQDPESAKLFGVSPVEYIRKNPATVAGTLVPGLGPAMEALEAFKDPEAWTNKWKTRAEGAYSNMFTEGQSANYSIPGLRQQILEPYKKQFGQEVYAQVQAEMPNAQPDEMQDRIDELLIDRIPNEHADLLLKHPYITQLAVQMGLDPLTPGVPLLKRVLKPVTTGASKLARPAIEAVGDIGTKSGKTLGTAFDANFNINKLESRGYEEAAAELASVEPKSQYRITQAQKTIEGLNQKIDKLVVSTEDKELFSAAVEGKGLERVTSQGFAYYTPEEVTKLIEQKPNIKAAIEEHRRVQLEHEALRTETGAGQVWGDEKTLLNPSRVKEGTYIPHRVTVDPRPESLLERTRIAMSPGLKKAKPSSSKARRDIEANWADEGPPTEYVQDPTKQWRTEMQSNRQSFIDADRIKRTNTILQKHGLVHEVPIAEAETRAADLAEASGMPWVSLEDSVNETWQRVSGTPLVTKRGESATLIPKIMEPHVAQLVAASNAKSPHAAVKAVVDMLGFTNRMFSKVQTTAWPIFHAAQATGNFMLGFLLAPRRAASIQGQAHALTGAAVNMFADPQFAKGIPFTTKTGTKGTKYDVLMAGRERGIFTEGAQHEVDLAAGASSGGYGPSRIEASINKALDKSVIGALPGKLAKAEDDAFRMTVFESFIDDFDPVSLDIAAKKTNEYIMNWRNMGWAEREVFQNVVPFYSWQRYGLLQLAPKLAANPQFLDKVLMISSELERAYGSNAPYTAAGMPEGTAYKAVTAPYKYQPKAQQEKIKKAFQAYNEQWDTAGRPAIGSDEFMMMTYENPAMTAVPIVNALFGNDKRTAARMAFPVYIAMIEMITGENYETGNKLYRFPTDMAEFGASPIGHLWEAYTGRISKFAEGLIALYEDDPIKQADMQLMLNLANNLGPLAPAVNAINGKAVIPEFPFGMRGRIVNPVDSAEWDRVKAVDEAYGIKSEVKRGLR